MTEHSERYWEARWRDEAKLTAEATAFLDKLANRFDGFDLRIAANCRAMARKLRGEA